MNFKLVLTFLGLVILNYQNCYYCTPLNENDLELAINENSNNGLGKYVYNYFWPENEENSFKDSSIISIESNGLNDCCGEKEWWQTTVIYQIYTRSFKDSNGDGYGDIQGIVDKLDYIVDLGIETLWIQPFYLSGGSDMGYDIAHFTSIDPLFGTFEDFDRLIVEAHKRHLKVIIDFVPNHTSDKHDWFQKSIDRIKPFDEFYLWRDAKFNNVTNTRSPPNNWLSVFGGPAWTWNDKRQQYYMHQFSGRQPDLNFRSKTVQKYMEDVLRFWLDKGIDGWRIDALKHLFEVDTFIDEPYKAGKEGSLIYSDINHLYTVDLPECYEILTVWRSVVDEYKAKDNRTRMLVVESYTNITETMKYYEFNGKKGAHFPFNFQFVGMDESPTKSSNATDININIHTWMDNMPKHLTANWVYGNHDNPRAATRFGSELAEGIALIAQFLPGAGTLYFGDEIGMENSHVRKDQKQDPNNAGCSRPDESRDPERCPMQWDTSKHAGFTTAPKPWLPINENYWHVNVDSEKKAKWSTFKFYKRIFELRKKHTFIYGDYKTFVMNGEYVLVIKRFLKDHDTYVVVVNFASEPQEVDISSIGDVTDPLYVMLPSMNSGYEIGQKVVSKPNDNSPTNKVIPASKIMLRPRASLLLVSTTDGKNPVPSSSTQSAISSLAIAFTLLIAMFR